MARKHDLGRYSKPPEGLPTRPCVACGWPVTELLAARTGGYCLEHQYCTASEAASILRVSTPVIYDLGRRGAIRRVKITIRCHRYLRSDIDHLASRTNGETILDKRPLIPQFGL